MRKRAFGLTIFCLLGLITPTLAQAQVRIVVNRDFINVRLYPELGATVVGTAVAGNTFVANGRSADNEWLRIDFLGSEAWVGSVVVSVLDGDINALPIRDPRTIPFGGLESPRAGITDVGSSIKGRLPTSGVRVRTGPSTAYRIIANAPRFTVFDLLGRTADNQWVQVNFDGTLGWVTAQFIEIQDNRNILELPVNGIVANELPRDFRDDNELFAVLRFMRERIDLAQPSLDEQRQRWTDAALGLPPPCGGYPARPSDLNTIPREILGEYFATLDPLLRDFNSAMGNVRDSIDLQIEVCGRQGFDAALTSAPVVSGGLSFVRDADNQFASLRRRIDELLPEIGPDDCIFAFGGRVDVLPVYNFGEVVEGEFTPSRFATGFCIDVDPVNIGRLEFIRNGSNYNAIIAVTPLDNPTNFIATGEGSASDAETNVVIQPINFPFEGRYLILISIEPEEGELPEGEYGFLFVDVAPGLPTTALLSYDVNGNLVLTNTLVGGGGEQIESQPGTVTNNLAETLNVYEDARTDSAVVGTLAPGQSVELIGQITDWVQVRLEDGTVGWVEAGDVSVSGGSSGESGGGSGGETSQQTLCPGLTLTCDNLFDCSEVQACVNEGSTVLDPNGNGIACDSAEAPELACSILAN